MPRCLSSHYRLPVATPELRPRHPLQVEVSNVGLWQGDQLGDDLN